MDKNEFIFNVIEILNFFEINNTLIDNKQNNFQSVVNYNIRIFKIKTPLNVISNKLYDKSIGYILVLESVELVPL